MSSSVYISAIKPPDDTWTKHKAVWDACMVAGVDIPGETINYFEGERPDPDGVKIEMGWVGHSEHEALVEGNDDHYYVMLIDISKLPENTRYIKLKAG